MAESEVPQVEIGFLENTESWKLESRFFPSKIGGRPAWLDLFNLPDVLCAKCKKTCIFLCQIYAPIEDNDFCFHRTLFVFVCKDSDCCNNNDHNNFNVFRCQLKRENRFYSFEPPIEDKTWQPDVIPEICNLCCVCGLKGPSRCGKCKMVYYCSKEHQKIDWRFHKAKCLTGVTCIQNESKTEILLPEFEIVIESENYVPDDTTDLKTEEERLKEYEKMIAEGRGGTLQDDPLADRDLHNTSSLEDKQFLKFSSRIKKDPEQILRYERGGEPLWISSKHVPSKNDVPSCEYCGGHRQFEFQILPQLLNHLNLDNINSSVDWGTLAVYTCTQSCEEGPAYKKEFLLKQDLSV